MYRAFKPKYTKEQLNQMKLAEQVEKKKRARERHEEDQEYMKRNNAEKLQRKKELEEYQKQM